MSDLRAKPLGNPGGISRSDINVYNLDIVTYCLLLAGVVEVSEYISVRMAPVGSR